MEKVNLCNKSESNYTLCPCQCLQVFSFKLQCVSSDSLTSCILIELEHKYMSDHFIQYLKNNSIK